jgi:hypothetical protein
MNSQKILASTTLLLAVPLFAKAGFVHFRKIGNPALTNDYPYIADGGAPRPPNPPLVFNSNIVLADGGAPRPPNPPLITNSNIVTADGCGDVSS